MPTLVLDEPEKKTKGPRLVLDEPPAQVGSFIDELPEDPYDPVEYEKQLRGRLDIAQKSGVSIDRVEDILDQTDAIGFIESTKEEFIRGSKGAQLMPIIGGIVGLAEQYQLLDAAERLKNDFDYSKPIREAEMRAGAQAYAPAIYRTKEQDQQLISNYLLKTIARQQRGYKWHGVAAKGLITMPTWMIEFAITGGLAKIGNEAVQNAGSKLLRNYAKTRIGQIALRTAGWTGGAITRGTLGLAPRVGEKMFERQVQVQLVGTEQEGWAMSFAKAWGDTVIEAASEEAGATITGIPSKLLSKTRFGAKFLKALEKGWMKATGGSAGEFARKVITKGGYSNIIGEFGEERLGTVLRAITNVDDFGAGKDADVIDRLEAGFRQDVNNLGAELVVLSAPMAAQMITGRFTGRLSASDNELVRIVRNIEKSNPQAAEYINEELSGRGIIPATEKMIKKSYDTALNKIKSLVTKVGNLIISRLKPENAENQIVDDIRAKSPGISEEQAHQIAREHIAAQIQYERELYTTLLERHFEGDEDATADLNNLIQGFHLPTYETLINRISEGETKYAEYIQEGMTGYGPVKSKTGLPLVLPTENKPTELPKYHINVRKEGNLPTAVARHKKFKEDFANLVKKQREGQEKRKKEHIAEEEIQQQRHLKAIAKEGAAPAAEAAQAAPERGPREQDLLESIPQQTRDLAIEQAKKSGKRRYIRHTKAKGEKTRGWFTRTTPPKSGDFFTVTPEGDIEFGIMPEVFKKQAEAKKKQKIPAVPAEGKKIDIFEPTEKEKELLKKRREGAISSAKEWAKAKNKNAYAIVRRGEWFVKYDKPRFGGTYFEVTPEGFVTEINEPFNKQKFEQEKAKLKQFVSAREAGRIKVKTTEKPAEKPAEGGAEKQELPKTIKTGYPEKEFIFTGEWSRQYQGYYKATRNKIAVDVPIYKSEDGEEILWMPEAVEVKKGEGPAAPERGKPVGGARMMSGFDPGLDRFIAEDVKPAVKGALKAVRAAGGVVKAIGHMGMDILEPARRAKKKAGTGAYVATIKAIHRAADVARLEFEQKRLDSIDMNVAELRKWFDKFTKEQQKDFVTAFAGQPGTPDAALMQKEAFDRLPEALQDSRVIKAVREISEQNYKDLKEVAEGRVGYVEDYFYGVFKNPEEVARFIDYWRSTEKFLKHKNVPSVADAIIYGLEAGRPVELRQGNYIDNLMAERLGIARLGAMRWLRDELIDTGKGVLIENMAEAPIEYMAVHDPVFDGYRVQPDLANLINKLISTNKVSQLPALNAIRKINNFIRVVKFIGSIFHQRVIIKAAMADSGYLGFLKKKSAYKWLTLASKRSWEQVKQEPDYKDWLEHGLGYRYSLEEQAMSSFDDFVEKIDSGNYLGGTLRAAKLLIKIAKSYPKWMFEQWIPMVKYLKAQDAKLELEKKLGRPINSAEKVAIVKEIQNFYGEMNERLFGRSGTATSVLRFFFQAPGFAEGNYRTNIKSLTEWGILGQEHSASRSRANIFNSLLITAMTATVGTLILTRKPPKKLENVDDLKDLWKVDTGQKDARGRRIMIDLLDYDKDYFNLYFNLFRGRPDEAVVATIKRVGGMKAPFFDTANDVVSVAMGKALYDWKGDRVVQITDPWTEKLAKIVAFESQKFEPISVSVFKQSRGKHADRIWSFLESVSGYRPTVSEKDKRESRILRMCWSLKGQKEETYISLAEIERPREAVEWYNNRVKDVLEGPLVDPKVRDEWFEELTIDLDKFLENKAQEASALAKTEDSEKTAQRAAKVLKNFGISVEEAKRLKRQKRERVRMENLSKKYKQSPQIMIEERLGRNEAMNEILGDRRIAERMKE